jgi:hypothetical protein
MKQQQATVAHAGSDICGLLRRRQSGAWEAGLDHDTAVLSHALASPRPARAVLRGQLPERRFEILARLICDQLLQIEDDDGAFVDGIAARGVLFGDEVATERLSDRLDPLSRAALDHAVAVGPMSSAALARRLYSFNMIPLSGGWRRRLVDMRSWLDLDRSGWPERLQGRYREQEVGAVAEVGSRPWLQWTDRSIGQGADLRHKIYVSPQPCRLAEVLAIVAETCRALGVPAFKVGATPFGALRPDKLVIYPDGRVQLRRVAEELVRVLDDVEVQGVPFAAPIDPRGLLSWAIDPGDDPARRGASWRTTVAESLASTIARSCGQASHEAIVEFALQRLRLDGIEPLGWRASKAG